MWGIYWDSVRVWSNFDSYEQAQQFIDYYDLELVYEIKSYQKGVNNMDIQVLQLLYTMLFLDEEFKEKQSYLQIDKHIIQ